METFGMTDTFLHYIGVFVLVFSLISSYYSIKLAASLAFSRKHFTYCKTQMSRLNCFLGGKLNFTTSHRNEQNKTRLMTKTTPLKSRRRQRSCCPLRICQKNILIK